MNQILLEMRGVGHTYAYDGFPLLEQIDFCVNKRETVTLLLSAQSGKSTLAKLAVGYMSSSKGEVLYRGSQLSRQKGEKNIFYLPQVPLLHQNKSVKFNLFQPQRLRGTDKREALSICNQLSQKYSLQLNQKVNTLSPKQQLDLAFARADLRQIDLFVIDDCVDYYQYIMDYVEKRECALLFITSRPNLAVGRVVIVDDKKTVFDGDKQGAIEYIKKVYWSEFI